MIAFFIASHFYTHLLKVLLSLLEAVFNGGMRRYSVCDTQHRVCGQSAPSLCPEQIASSLQQYVSMHMCTHIHTYTCTHTHTYTQTHTQTVNYSA